MPSQRCRCALSGKSSLHLAVGLDEMSSGSPDSATQRNGPLPSQNSGRMYAGTKPGKSNASATPSSSADLADVVAVVERRDALRVEREHRLDMRADRVRFAARDKLCVLRGIALRGAPAARRVQPPGR